MRLSWIAVALILGLGGCGSKNAFEMFGMDSAHEKAVEQMRTGTIVKSFETKAIVSSVYLNPIHPEEYRDGEYFIGAFYFEKRNLDVKKWDLAAFGYTLTLNGNAPVSMEELKENDPRRTLIPIQNRWNKYYLIRFDPVTADSLALLLSNDQTGSVALEYPRYR